MAGPQPKTCQAGNCVVFFLNVISAHSAQFVLAVYEIMAPGIETTRPDQADLTGADGESPDIFQSCHRLPIFLCHPW